jgi:hypothetical protein
MTYLPNPALLSHLPRLPEEIWHMIDRIIHRMYMQELRNNIIYDVYWFRVIENNNYSYSFIAFKHSPNYYDALKIQYDNWSDE